MTTIHMTKPGRAPGLISYTDVFYNEKNYVVASVKHNYEIVQFVFDKDDYEKVSDRAWHVSSGKYIGSTFYTDESVNNKKELYLHNLVMGRLNWSGKGAKETIDHINRIGFDNRKENLRLITQSQQNQNQTKRERSITLPEGCGVDPSEIPRHIWYIRANGAHGDRFAIEFKTEGLCWKTTSSKKVTLSNKLHEAKDKLQEFYKEYPHLNPFQEEKIAQEDYLKKSFEEIIKIATTETDETSENTLETNYETESIAESSEEIIPIPIKANPFTQTLPKKEKKESSPTQWKISNIYSYCITGKEEIYLNYLRESNPDVKDMDERFTTLLAQIKTNPKEKAEEIIQEFVHDLRRIRHNALCYTKNHKVLDRDDREVWRAESVLHAFEANRLEEFKKFTEENTGDKGDDPVWMKRWESFVEGVKSESDISKKKAFISKFLTAQRTKKYRRVS